MSLSNLQVKDFTQFFKDKDPRPTVLVVDDSHADRLRMRVLLGSGIDGEDLRILEVSSIGEAESILSNCPVHVMLLDKNLGPNEGDPKQNGVKSIPDFLQIQPNLGILVISGNGKFDDVKDAIKYGAIDFISKYSPSDLIMARITHVIKHAKLLILNSQIESSINSDFFEVGGQSEIFKQVLNRAASYSQTELPILITGSTGTGKSELAKCINQCRAKLLKQNDRPFFPINIATLAPGVADSILFGHEGGAFTDASRLKLGLFEVANNGTLFLDEIDEASLELQTKLLTVIETREFYRVGGTKKLTTTAKIIFATNRNLEEMVRAKTFRLDLYMRINTLVLRMPDLDERQEDIPDIIRALMPKVAARNNVDIAFSDLPPDFIENLMTARVEGNIRGIANQLDRLCVFCPKDSNQKPILKNWRSIPGLYLKSPKANRAPENTGPITFEEIKRRSLDVINGSFPGLKDFSNFIKSKVIQEAYDKSGGELKKMAEVLKVTNSYIYPLSKRNHSLEDNIIGAIGEEYKNASTSI